MRSPLTLAALLVSGQLLLGCSSDGSDDPPVTVDDGTAAIDDGLPDTTGDGGPSAGICAVPPDLRTGDAATYRYTDSAGTAMDVSFSVASTENDAILLDVNEGEAVYQAAVTTFCNDTPGLDLAGGETSDPMQALFEQYASRPLLHEIVQPGFGRFADGMDPGLADDVQDACAENEESVPTLGTAPVATYECTYTYGAGVAGGTATVDTVLAQTRREMQDYGRLVRKVQTETGGTVRSLVLVSFDAAG